MKNAHARMLKVGGRGTQKVYEVKIVSLILLSLLVPNLGEGKKCTQIWFKLLYYLVNVK